MRSPVTFAIEMMKKNGKRIGLLVGVLILAYVAVPFPFMGESARTDVRESAIRWLFRHNHSGQQAQLKVCFIGLGTTFDPQDENFRPQELLVVLLAGGDANQMPRHSQYHVIDGRNWTDFMVDVVAQHVAAVRADGTGKGFLNLTPTVFLCHAKEDSALVGLLCSELRTHGLAPWFDKDKLLVGDRWREEIAHAIQTCHFFLICLTQQAATKRGFIQRELRFAISEYSQRPQNCPFLLPVRLQPCEVPQIVLDETSYLPHFQWFDLYDLHDGSVHRLAEMIHRQFQKLRDAGESRTSKWTVSPEGRDAAVSETVT